MKTNMTYKTIAISGILLIMMFVAAPLNGSVGPSTANAYHKAIEPACTVTASCTECHDRTIDIEITEGQAGGTTCMIAAAGAAYCSAMCPACSFCKVRQLYYSENCAAH